MFNHAPENYKCPICLGVNGIENSDTLIAQTDIVYKDDLATAFISSFFIGNNPGHVIIVPNEHYENLYDLPEEVGAQITKISKTLALAQKEARNCTGTTILQNNEPDGNQHAFHYHLHVFPRFKDDELHKNMHNSTNSTAEERLPFAESIRIYLKNHQ